MNVITEELSFSSKGFCDIINITNEVDDVIKRSKIIDGLVNISIVGSTAAVTTLEYEPSLVNDFKEILEKLIPSNKSYNHDKTWGDANGFSHLRSALIGTSKAFPVKDKELVLGTWQQIILVDFDNRPRTRKVMVQVIGK